MIPPWTLIAVLWPLVIASLAFPSETLKSVMSALLAVYVVLSLVRARWQVQTLCGALGLLALGLAAAFGVWNAFLDGLGRALIIAAFMPSIVLLRATAEQRPEIAAARRVFAGLDERARDRSVLVGSHLIGSILIIGVFALLAPILGQSSDEAARRRTIGVALRGLCIAVLWSPFFVGMGLANEYLPGVELAAIMPMGIGFAALALITSHLMFDRAGGVAGLWGAIGGFAPVLPGVAIAAGTVIALTAATALTTLQALVVGMPALCIAVLASMGRQPSASAFVTAREGLGNVGNEIAIVTVAMMLGSIVESAIGQGAASQWLAGIDLAPPAWIALAVFAVTAGGLAGLHPIVTVTVMLALLRTLPTGLADVVLMQTALFGWSFGTMVSVSAISIATASAMFDVRPEQLVRGENLLFVVVFGTLSVFILSIVNYFLMG